MTFSANQFRSEYDSHLYELMTRVFWSEEKVVSDLKVSEQEQFLEQEKEGFEAIRAAFSQNDKEAPCTVWRHLFRRLCRKN